MCGIAGILSQDPNNLPSPPDDILEKMLSRLEHRGPDDSGKIDLSFPQCGLSLGHQRLSVIDLSKNGRQPMSNQEKSFWIVSNNEIYNYQEIRSELTPKYSFRSRSDTEVLLYAFQHWGMQAFERLRGMFAFGIWDSQRKSLILARDRLGVKPLYYYHDSKNLIFASELRAILASELIQPKLDTQGLFQYLSFGRLQAPHSMIEGIRELPPGHYCEWIDGHFEEKPYWELKKHDGPQYTPSIENTKNSIESAVESRLASDVPVGLFLSGGIDSSALLSIMSKFSPNNQSLSLAFVEQAYDESNYARISANASNSEHHEIKIRSNDLIESLPLFLDAMDQPTIDGVNIFMISRHAKKLGWKVAVSGLGSDELFGGYDSFKMFPLLKKIAGLPEFILENTSSLFNLFLTIPALQSDKSSKIKDLFDRNFCGSMSWHLLRSLFNHRSLQSLFNDKSIFDAEYMKHYENTVRIEDKIKHWSLFDQVSYLEITQYMTPTLLKDADVMGMKNGLEIRVPFTDHLLVEKVLSFPSNFKTEGKAPKPLLLKALEDSLPREIVNRRKMGFTLPFEDWLKGPLKTEIESVLLTPVSPLSEYLNESGVHKIWEQFMKGKTSWSRPWSIYVLKKWADKHIH